MNITCKVERIIDKVCNLDMFTNEAVDKIDKLYKKEMEKQLSLTRKEVIGEIYWLLDCEEDGLETSGFDTSVVKNIRSRVNGHFKPNTK